MAGRRERDRERDWDEEPESGPEPTRFGLLEGLQVVFGVAACFGLVFHLQGPAQNPAQTLFRLGVVAVGAVGLVVVTVLRLALKRRP